MILAMLVAGLSIASAAFAQDQVDTCYPVPPGGCVEAEVQCEEIIAAIEAGELDEDALPAECEEEEVAQAQEDEAEGEGEEEAAQAQEDEAEDEAEGEEEEEVMQAQEGDDEGDDEGDVTVLAATGLSAGVLAMTGLAGLLLGLLFLRAGRRA